MKLLLVAVICFAAGYLVSSQFTDQEGSAASLEIAAETEHQSNNAEESEGSSVDQADESSTQVNPSDDVPSIADLTTQIGEDNQVAIIFDTQHTPRLDLNSAVDALSQTYSVQKMKLGSVTGSQYQAIVIFGFADLREAEKVKPKLEQELELRSIIRYAPACINDPPDNEGFVCSDSSSDSSPSEKPDT